MTKSRKAPKQGGGRKERIRARMAASAMASPEELAAVLGISLNKAYEVLRGGKVRAMRLRQRWLIPRTEIARLTGSDMSQLIGGDVIRLIEGEPAE